MPRVIHVVRKFEPAEWGGTETHLVALIREQVQLGWECEVHAPREKGTDGTILERAGARFRTFRARYPYLRMSREQRAGLVAAGGNLLSADELAKLCVLQADVLHLHTLGRLGGVVRTAARMRRRPYAVTLHGPVRADASVVESDARRRTQGMVDVGAPFGLLLGARRVVQDADLVFVLNRAEESAWAKTRKAKHLARVAHGVSLDRASEADRREARGRAGVGAATFWVLVGRVDRAKGQDLAIRAFSEAPSDVHLVLAGSVSDPSFAREVAALIDVSPMRERIHSIGGVPPHIARALLGEAALALVPSRAEPFGIVLLEAWAEGTPALFSDVGGLGDIARNTDAHFGLVAPDDLEAWTDRLRALADCAREMQCERDAVRSRVAAHYAWRTLAEQIVEGYNAVRR